MRSNQPTPDVPSLADGEDFDMKTIGLYLFSFVMFAALAWLAVRTF